MTQKIFDIKKKLLDELESELERVGSIRNMNTQEMGMVVDMVKDLAEAEEKCWKACYYKTVVEAMEMSAGGNIERMGYMPEGYSGAMGYSQGGGSMGYGNGGGSMGYSNRMGATGSGGGSMGGRSGYSDQSMQNIRHMMETADPQRREQLKQDLQRLIKEAGI